MTKEFLLREYVQNGRSTCDIARELCTHANTVRRALESYRIELRDKSEAQKRALSAGRSEHPTAGRTRSNEERMKISAGVTQFWEGLTDLQRKQRIAYARKRYEESRKNE